MKLDSRKVSKLNIGDLVFRRDQFFRVSKIVSQLSDRVFHIWLQDMKDLNEVRLGTLSPDYMFDVLG